MLFLLLLLFSPVGIWGINTRYTWCVTFEDERTGTNESQQSDNKTHSGGISQVKFQTFVDVSSCKKRKVGCKLSES